MHRLYDQASSNKVTAWGYRDFVECRIEQEEIIQLIIAYNLLVVRIYAAIFYDADIQDLVTWQCSKILWSDWALLDERVHVQSRNLLAQQEVKLKVN